MIAKIIVHGENRFDALMKMQRALYELEIEGVVTNADFQLDLISDRRVDVYKRQVVRPCQNLWIGLTAQQLSCSEMELVVYYLRQVTKNIS